ncbi:Xaa-Pro dipeptidase [Streptococcus varani]|uniref:Xaa-Pro dipeptidase n=1 Tax=Streptococcus varani TaxID=1608583 RepID=A0A0E4H537_9STRE|nr:YigZ family protein [Streptococcus varani]CQR25762.1 Xaa-Pro dipeptidase [Streptococcus varani]
MKEFVTIKEDGIVEQEIKKSRFICHLKRVKTEEEARNFINSIKKEHYKANHNCSAFILGENSEIKRSSDDGEPSGTAGVPMLTVLENHNLTDTVAVVTRYFGGIKLGAGGLIRAYAGSVAHAIEEIGKLLVKEQQGISVKLSYAQYQEFANWRSKHDLEEYGTEFLADIMTNIYADKENVNRLLQDLEDYYSGKVTAKQSDVRIIELNLH